jgi:N-acetylneuraminic acid mutarotase
MSGSSAPANLSVAGVYGTLGQFAAANVPGSRELAMTWTDGAGHLWLFGGYGYDANGSAGNLNDLWEFDPATRQWAWMAGSKLRNQSGIYGVLRASASETAPGARWGGVSWIDKNGALWLFGGDGFDSDGMSDLLNDLWKFDPVTRHWTWMGGSARIDQAGNYGRLDVAASTNVPGARQGDVVWTDPGGHVWLFGGLGESGSGAPPGMLDDVWKLDLNTLDWTWVGGLNTAGSYQGPQWPGNVGVYGKLGVPDPGNTPGSRVSPAAWTDAKGNFWLLGGSGFDSEGNSGILNDMWEYVPAKKLWAWMGGSATAPVNQPLIGRYGQYGVPNSGNSPGSRLPAASWTDRSGNLWLFGGEGYDSVGVDGLLNDLWKYSSPEK